MSFSVAFVGPDGAGKSTVCRRLCQELGWPARYLYMGINLEASNTMLPTTRLWLELKRLAGRRPDMGGPRALGDDELRGGWKKRLRREIKSLLRMTNLLGEEWFRQMLCWYWQWRGELVLFDRHFYLDYYVYDIAPGERQRTLASRLHGWMLDKCYPRPDVVIVLDAPGDYVYHRKGESTVELLENRRQEYLGMQSLFEHFYVLDASQPLDEVVQQAASIIAGYREARSPVEITRSLVATNGSEHTLNLVQKQSLTLE